MPQGTWGGHPSSADSSLSPRSTPCPSVKHGDEWGEPSRCESGDSCQYCHSRTEQQFHPEVREHPRSRDRLKGLAGLSTYGSLHGKNAIKISKGSRPQGRVLGRPGTHCGRCVLLATMCGRICGHTHSAASWEVTQALASRVFTGGWSADVADLSLWPLQRLSQCWVAQAHLKSLCGMAQGPR